MWMAVKHLWDPAVSPFGCVSRGRAAASCDSCSFKFLRNSSTVLPAVAPFYIPMHWGSICPQFFPTVMLFSVIVNGSHFQKCHTIRWTAFLSLRATRFPFYFSGGTEVNQTTVTEKKTAHSSHIHARSATGLALYSTFVWAGPGQQPSPFTSVHCEQAYHTTSLTPAPPHHHHHHQVDVGKLNSFSCNSKPREYS